MINTKNSSTKDWVWLFGAIAVTVLFIVFSEPIICALYMGTDLFAESMYNFNLYFTVSIFISLTVWVFAILYYWVIDRVKLSSFVAWALFCVFAVGVSGAVTYFYPMSVFYSENLEFITDIPLLAIVSLPISLVLYIIVSLGAKGLSTNCSTRPF